MPASTTKAPSVYGKQTILTAMDNVRERVIEENFSDTTFKAAAKLACDMFIQLMKKELFG